MINEELITEFMHTELQFNMNVKCNAFTIISNKISANLKINDKPASFGKIFNLERYNNWYQNKIQKEREEKLKKLGL